MAFDAGTITAQLDVDRTPFQQGLDRAKQDARDFADSKPTVSLGLDDTAARSELSRFKDQLQQLNDRRVASPRIGLDTTAAETQLRRLQEQLRQISGGNANVGINAGGVTAELARVTAQLDQLGRQVARPRVEIDTQAARAALDDLRARLQALNAYRANPQIDLDGYALARAQVESLQRQLDQLSRTRATPSVGGINNLGSASSGAADKLAKMHLSLLGVAAALSPGLIPVAAVATGGLLGLGGAFLAAGAGAGLFGFAAKTNLTAVLDAVKKFDKEGEAALNGLTDAQKDVANELIHLKDRWKDAADSVKPQTYAVAVNVLQGVSQALDKLRPLLTNAANAFQTLSAGFEKATRGRTFSDFTDFLSRQAGPAILTFGKVLGDLGATVAHVFEAFEPLIRPAEDALLRFTGSLRTWSEGLKTNNGFQKFLDYVRTNGPLVGRTLGDIGRAVTALLAALAPLGPPIVLFVDNMARFVKQIADNDGVRFALRQFADALEGLAKYLGSDWGKLTLIAIGIKLIGAAITSNPWIAGLATAVLAFGWLYDHDPGLAKGLLAVAAAMWAVNYAGYGLVGVPIVGALAAVGVGIYEAIKHWKGLKGAIGDAAGAVNQFWGNLVGTNAPKGSKDYRQGWMEEFGSAIFDWVKGLGPMIKQNFSQLLGNLGQWLGPDFIGKIAQMIKENFSHLGGTLGGAGSWLLQAGKDIISGLWNGIKQKGSELLHGIGDWLYREIVDPIKRAFRISSPSLVMMGIGRDIVQGLINGILSLVSRIGGLFSGAFSAITSFAGRAISAINGFASRGVAGINSFVSRGVGAINSFVSRGVSAVASFASRALSGLNSFVSRGVSAINGFVSRGVGAIASFASRAVSGINSFVSRGVGAIGSFVSRGVSAIASFASRAASGIASFASRGASAIASFVSRGLGSFSSFAGQAVSTVASMGSRIIGTLSGFASQAFSGGLNIVQSIARGISSGIGAVGGAIGSVLSFINDRLPHSPAKAGPLSGRGSPDIAGLKIATMLADGLRQGIPHVSAASDALVGVGYARPAMAGAGSFGAGSGRPVRGGDTYILNGVGPDVEGRLREERRQRDFHLGA